MADISRALSGLGDTLYRGMSEPGKRAVDFAKVDLEGKKMDYEIGRNKASDLRAEADAKRDAETFERNKIMTQSSLDEQLRQQALMNEPVYAKHLTGETKHGLDFYYGYPDETGKTFMEKVKEATGLSIDTDESSPYSGSFIDPKTGKQITHREFQKFVPMIDSMSEANTDPKKFVSMWKTRAKEDLLLKKITPEQHKQLMSELDGLSSDDAMLKAYKAKGQAISGYRGADADVIRKKTEEKIKHYSDKIEEAAKDKREFTQKKELTEYEQKMQAKYDKSDKLKDTIHPFDKILFEQKIKDLNILNNRRLGFDAHGRALETPLDAVERKKVENDIQGITDELKAMRGGTVQAKAPEKKGANDRMSMVRGESAPVKEKFPTKEKESEAQNVDINAIIKKLQTTGYYALTPEEKKIWDARSKRKDEPLMNILPFGSKISKAIQDQDDLKQRIAQNKKSKQLSSVR